MSKKKEKEVQNDSSSDAPHTPAQPSTPRERRDEDRSSSMASRIQDSASDLLRNAISGPSGHGLAVDLSQSLANGSKARPSASLAWAAGSSAAAVALLSRGAGGSASSSARDGAGTFAPESFRSGATAQGGFELDQLAQEDFERGRGYIDDLDVSTRTDFHDLKGKGKQREIQFLPGQADDVNMSNCQTTWEEARRQQQHHQHPPPPSKEETTTTTSTPQTAEPLADPSDGAAVVALLSDPSFQPEFLPSSADDDLLDTDTIPSLTESEIQIIDSFRRHPSSHANGQTQQPHRLTSSSLIPDIDAFLAQDSITGSGTGTETVDTETLRNMVLSHLPGAEDWMAVEERYHDEVWGYLRPTLEAAKKEIEEKKEKEKQGSPNVRKDGPAVRRLKMILRHMQA